MIDFDEHSKKQQKEAAYAAECHRTSKKRVLALLDEFCEAYDESHSKFLPQDRVKATLWDLHQLRYKIDKELPDDVCREAADEIERLQREWDSACRSLAELHKLFNDRGEYINRLRAAWEKYGRHGVDCQRYGPRQCTCGFTEAREALRGADETSECQHLRRGNANHQSGQWCLDCGKVFT